MVPCGETELKVQCKTVSGKTALTVIGGQTFSASRDPSSPAADLCHVSCCAESTCGSARTQRETGGNIMITYKQELSSLSFHNADSVPAPVPGPVLLLHLLLNDRIDRQCLLIILTFVHHHY